MNMGRYKASKMLMVVGAGALLGAGMGAFEANAIKKGPRIEREGDATHRELMLAMETQPFDVELFNGLDSWTLGKVLDSETIKDQVVLIAMVSVDDPKSMMMMSSLARLQRQNEDKGLVTLAVHPENQWDTLQEKVNDGRVKVQVAQDMGGHFATALSVDDYPDVYLIDRAGQLRYADITKKSLPVAIKGLLNETPEEAVANAQLQAQGEEVLAEAKEPEKRQLTSEDYANVSWPAVNSGTIKGKNVQGKGLPVPLGSEEWITKPVELDGKVLVLDFWATWCGPCRRASPMLEEMQDKYTDQLAVLAISGQRDPEADVRKYVFSKRHSYSHLYDAKQSVYRELKITAIPHTVIMSTDGIVRWQGNPLSPAFKTALEQVIAVDPMFIEE